MNKRPLESPNEALRLCSTFFIHVHNLRRRYLLPKSYTNEVGDSFRAIPSGRWRRKDSGITLISILGTWQSVERQLEMPWQ